MSKIRLGKKPLRLLVLSTLLALSIGGCGTSKYEAVDLSSVISSENAVVSTEIAAFTIGESAENGVENSAGTEETLPDNASDAESSAKSYEEVHDWVIVTADVLNVRKTDSKDSRIYVQLKNGDVLERIGYNDEWSQVMYDGEIAYVASDMVAVTELPTAEETSEAENTETEAEEGIMAPAGENGISGVESAAPIYEKTGKSQEEETEVPSNGHVVAIDAGHQAKANAEKEPIGPSSSTMKAKMPEGAVGTSTGVKEYELTLTVAKKLEEELESRGYEIVMVRTSHDVNLSNAERSIIANESDAEIFIRLHANSMENSGVYGALAMCMTEYNPYNAELYADSYKLSKKIINNICSLTGTKNRGVQKVDNSSAINWSEIPVSVVEMGFLTNPDEDRWLQNDDYQNKIVEGIAKAVDDYFTEKN